MTIYSPIKACFSNRKYHVKIQTRTTIIVNSIFLIEKNVLIEFLRIIGVLSLIQL